jgi:hypothetical protein
MANWGEGANAFGDNFLKAYTTIQQNSRANEEAERLKAAQANQDAYSNGLLESLLPDGSLDIKKAIPLALKYSGPELLPQILQSMQPKETSADKLLKTGRYSPASIMNYIKTGDMSVLEPLEKPQTNPIALVAQDLEQRLGRKPTASEILTAGKNYQVGLTGDKAAATETAKNDANKGLITDDVITEWARYVATKGEFPMEATRFFRNAGAQADINNRVMAKLKEWKVDGADRVVQGATFKAGQSSLAFQEKQRGAAESFANNINGQIDKVDSIMKDVIKRVGTRAIDMPLVKWKKEFIGSGQERVLESYLMEISREIGKLSTGSQASIAELSVEAQKKWDKIHDPNLSMTELKKILEATREQANIRVKSIDDETNVIKERLYPSRLPEFKITLQPGENEKDVMDKVNKIPKGAVTKLLGNPNLATQFELKYGRGTSKWFLGAKNEKRF